jgi:hypothetical protein
MWKPSSYRNENYPRLEIKERSPGMWAICDGGFVLNNESKWEYEPMPSNRIEEFIKRTRFPLETAMNLIETIGEKYYEKKEESLSAK